MAQKDYVSRGRSIARNKKKNSKTKSASGLPTATLVVAIAIVTIFIGGLFFITQQSKKQTAEEASLSKTHKAPANTLPPKPEERWRYIRELENRGNNVPPTLRSTTDPNNSNISRPNELTSEQRQLLQQLDADRQTKTDVRSVPRSQVVINEPATPVQQLQRTVPVAPPMIQNQAPKAPEQPQLHIKPTPQPQKEAAPASTKEIKSVEKSAKIVVEKKETNAITEKTKKMLVQCGSFRERDQAESVRAILALSGVESRISSGSGWHRVVLGPYSKEAAESAKTRATSAGAIGCILQTVGG